eukprot:gb/GFBE01035637.1/.p1 GENE.gb/GFBE01035637.1/~~gb/GFBE01035637.1/.p1  ORF type:complete len:571 (+),score=114.47 gb/GFBE01035637.1/:1-1713(+)
MMADESRGYLTLPVAGARRGLEADTTLDIRLYWAINHRLDFVSGVIDFVDCTKQKDAAKLYGFSIKGDEAVCKEGYASAKGFLDHFDSISSAKGPLPSITECKRRIPIGDSDPLGPTIAAGTMRKLEAHGPKAEVEELLAALRAMGVDQTTELCGWHSLVGAAVFNVQHFESPELFVEDSAVTVLMHWDVKDASLVQLTTLTERKLAELPLQALRRFGLAEDKAGTAICSIECTSAEDAWEMCKTMKQQIKSSGAKLTHIEVHGPADEVEQLEQRREEAATAEGIVPPTTFWHLLHGAFFVPDMFCDHKAKLLRARSCSSVFTPPASRPGAGAFSHEDDDTSDESCKVPVSMRGMSMDQLADVNEEAMALFGDEFGTKMLYDINESIIQPSCAESGLPYAVMLNESNPLPGKVFVTHAWAEKFAEFCKCVAAALTSMTSEYPYLWICAFAIFQTTDPALISRQLGGDPRQAPFTRALSRADYFLVVRNDQVDIYERIWCIWELYLAFTQGFLTSDKLIITGPNTFRSNARVNIENARSSDENDKLQIMEAIKQEDGVKSHIEFLITLLHQ